MVTGNRLLPRLWPGMEAGPHVLRPTANLAGEPPRLLVPLAGASVHRERGQWLPSLALVLFLVAPVTDQLLPAQVQRLPSVCILVLALWGCIGFRSMEKERPSLTWVTVCSLSVLWLLYSYSTSIDVKESRQWILAFALGLLLTATKARRAGPRTSALLENSYILSAAVVGLASCVEWLTKTNPFEGSFAAAAGPAGVQHWSVYRSSVTLGHPLVAGTYLSAAASYAIVQSGSVRGRRRAHLIVAGAIASMGLLCTVSRSSILALAISLGVGLIVPLVRRPEKLLRMLPMLLLATIGLALLASSSVLSARTQSAEGIQSGDYRSTVLGLARDLAATTGHAGSGPGTSQKLATRYGISTLLENSAAETLVSIGIIGLLLVTTILVLILKASLERERYAVASSLVALIVNSLAFDLWETNIRIFAMFGLLAILCWEDRAEQ